VPRIDPTARVAEGARLAEDVEVGPYCIIGSQVELHAGVRLHSHVNIAGVTVIGERTEIYPFASLGSPPQSTAYRGGATRLVVGADCRIREGVTISTGSEDGGEITSVGINVVGLRRRGFGRDAIHRIRRAYRMLFGAEGTFSERRATTETEFSGDPVVGKILSFIRDSGNRPLMMAVDAASDAGPP
jgi:acyl-[acyl carrier protein]--UDP-N-acetylglucosamine O-acyltransferase